MNGDSISPRQKGLALNLDATRYGAFVEIGGGLEFRKLRLPTNPSTVKHDVVPETELGEASPPAPLTEWRKKTNRENR